MSIPKDEGTAWLAPGLLYVGEFPPSNHHGGAILLRRLLGRHPAASLTAISSRLGMKASQAHDPLSCKPVLVPTFHLPGMLGEVAKAFEVVFVAVRTIVKVRRKPTAVVISIVQGRYYLAAAFAAWVTGAPHLTIVHDNFLSKNIGPSGAFRTLKRYLTRKTLQRADHVYAVSPQMQLLILEECDVAAEIQLPSTTTPVCPAYGLPNSNNESIVVILFAGLIGYTVKDCLDLLVTLIRGEECGQYGLSDMQLHLYTSLTAAQLTALGWDHKNVVCKGWLPQAELAHALASADILFLPYSFCEIARDAVETAFPSKTADYLAAGKPLLVFGPDYSSLVRYAADLGFAEIVTDNNLAALKRGISHIVNSADYRERLAARAVEVFAIHHNIARQQDKFYATLARIINRSTRT